MNQPTLSGGPLEPSSLLSHPAIGFDPGLAPSGDSSKWGEGSLPPSGSDRAGASNTRAPVIAGWRPGNRRSPPPDTAGPRRRLSDRLCWLALVLLAGAGLQAVSPSATILTIGAIAVAMTLALFAEQEAS